MRQFVTTLALTAAFFGAPAAQASPVTFTAVLNGASELPATGSPGTGSATVIFDTATHTMDVAVVFSGLLGITTASHIHCCAAAANVGVATVLPTFTGFPLSVSAGSYSHLFDMALAASYNPTFISSHGGSASTAEAALFAGMLADESYLNVHTNLFGGGEIRGILHEVQGVPEPGSLALLGGARVQPPQEAPIRGDHPLPPLLTGDGSLDCHQNPGLRLFDLRVRPVDRRWFKAEMLYI